MAELINVVEGEDHRGRFLSFSLSNKPDYIFTCDPEDIELLKDGKFYVHVSTKNRVYIRANNGEGGHFHFHRLVIGLGKHNPNSVADHRDRNTLNNRRYNLRETDCHGNRMNCADIDPFKHFGIYGLSVTWINTRGLFQVYYRKKYLICARSRESLEEKIEKLRREGFFNDANTLNN